MESTFKKRADGKGDKGKENKSGLGSSNDPIGNRKAVQYRSGAEYQILTGLTLPDAHHLNTLRNAYDGVFWFYCKLYIICIESKSFEFTGFSMSILVVL